MAGSRIKGITIEIEGNTTKLQSALKDTNKELKTTQDNLKDVNKLLKLDPKNTELLEQKQKYLKTAIDDTKKKLEAEKEALRQLKDADQTPEVIAQQEALERQIAEDEAALQGLTKESDTFGSVGLQAFFAVGEQVKEVGLKMMDFGETLTTHVSAPIAAIGGAAIAAFKDVDDGYDEMIKKTGATGEEADKLREIMENIATTIPTDFKTAGEAVGEVSTRFGVTGEELETLAGQFIKFADLNNTDVSTSVDKVQKALAAFGLDADDAEAFLDRLNKTGQDTGISVDKLADGIIRNSAAFQEMGLNIDDAVVFMGNVEKSGADADTVMNGLSRALKNATKEGKPLDQALAELQDTILNGTDSTDGLTAAYDLFGKSGAQVYEAVKNGTLDFTNLAGAAQETGDSVSETFEETQDPLDQFKTTMNELKLAGADVGNALLEVLQPAIETIKEVIEKLREKWQELSPEQQEMIVKIGLIVAAIGPLITIVGALVAAIGAIMSPIGLVVVAIGAAIAIGVALYENWDKICEWANRLKEKVVEAWENVKEKVVGFVTNIKEKVSEAWNNIKEKVSNAAESVKNSISSKFEAAKTIATTIWSNVKDNTAKAWDAIKGKIDENGGGIKGIITTAMEAYKSVWEAGFNFLDSLTNGKLSSIAGWFTEKFESIKSFVSDIVEWFKGIFDFEWHLPSIKLPHFDWTWKSIGGIVDIPVISVQWYRKAYDNPYLFTSPTVVGGRGFGDGGGSGEIVYGRDQLMRDIAEASGGDEITINVYASEGMDVNQLADQIQQRLALVQRQRASAYA